jgi:hypothetical protein
MQFPTAIDALLQVGEAVVADGFDTHEEVVADLVAAARHLGVRPVLVDIVADRHGPTPARERALGRLLLALAAVADRPAPIVSVPAA